MDNLPDDAIAPRFEFSRKVCQTVPDLIETRGEDIEDLHVDGDLVFISLTSNDDTESELRPTLAQRRTTGNVHIATVLHAVFHVKTVTH